MDEQFSFPNILPSKETHSPSFVLGNCTAFKTDLNSSPSHWNHHLTTPQPPRITANTSTFSAFLFFTPVSSFSATPRGNDCLMHENGKEFSGAQKINQKNSCMLEFCMRCLEETAALYTFGERKGIPVRCFWTYIHSCDLVFISASFFLKHNRTILSKWQHKMLL